MTQTDEHKQAFLDAGPVPKRQEDGAPDQRTASQVSQHLLDVTGRAFATRDADLFTQWFVYPQKLSTFETTIVVENRAQMARTFHKLCDHFSSQGVTQMVRVCISAEFVAPDRAEATHMTHLMAGHRRVKPPYPGFSSLGKINGVWRILSSQYAVEHNNGHALALTSSKRTAPTRFSEKDRAND